MTEFSAPIKTVNVAELDPYDAKHDPYDVKAILAMQATAAHLSGDDEFASLNQQLHEAAEAVSSPPVMTYEDIVLTNPVFDTARVLSPASPTAEAEARFYRAHVVIEGSLGQAIQKIMSFGDNQERLKEVPTFSIEPTVLTHAEHAERDYPEAHVAVALQGLKNLRGALTPDLFASFRDYFMGGLNGYAGPSGLYSATIPILDLVSNGGVNLEDGVRQFMKESIDQGMYPNRYGHADLMQHLLDSEDPKMDMPDESRTQIAKTMNMFRVAHSGAVSRLLPKVYKGELPGSGGIDNYQKLINSKMIDTSNN